MITEHELHHQLRHRGIDVGGLLQRMIDLEERGLIESTLCFRLTQKGVEQPSDIHLRPNFAGNRWQRRCRD